MKSFVGAAAVALSLALPACGPDGQSLGDTADCPDQPLYSYVFDTATKKWVRVTPGDDGGVPLDAGQLEAISRAEVHCLAPAGNAANVDQPTSRDAGGD